MVQHLMLYEYEAAERGEITIIWVSKHKLGDKNPATMALDFEIMGCMDR